MGFVVLPELEIFGAMLNSTWLARKTREEQQQMHTQLLFYHRTRANHKIDFNQDSTITNFTMKE